MLSQLFEFLTAHYPLYFLFFVCGVAARSQTMYWIGRYGNHLATRATKPEGRWKAAAWEKIHDPRTEETMELLRQRGLILIPLSFLTIGIQSVINMAAGAIALGWRRYTLAAIPGWLIWAGIYTTVGLALISKPVTVLVLAGIVAVLYASVIRPRRQRARLLAQAAAPERAASLAEV